MNEQTEHLPEPATETTEPEPDHSSDASQEVEPSSTPGGTEDTFPREYVEQLRAENQRYRQAAKDREDLAEQLFHARVASLGKLADPSDLPYAEDMLNDLPALEAAVDDLLTRKPHLAARTPRGDIGQGVTGTAEVSLLDMLGGRR